MALTDVEIRQAKRRDAPYKLSDAGGLFLQITPTGSKLWRLKYRYAGREKLLSLGPYPDVSLSKAREHRESAKRALRAGDDPSETQKAAKASKADAQANTFGLIANEFIAREEKKGRATATIVKARWFLTDLASPLADRPVTMISVGEALKVLRSIEGKGNLESARRCRSAMSRVFKFAIETGRATSDPTATLGRTLIPPQVKHHAAITDPKAVGELLVAIDALEGSPVVSSALRFLVLAFPRPGELRHAEWSEFDLTAAVWEIPAHKMKMRRPHRVPLSSQSVNLLKKLREITGGTGLAFPGVRNAKTPLSENTLNVALRRLGYTSDQMTAHGFRTVASTLLNESGLWHADAIERALAHEDGDSTRKAYARGAYWDERVKMAQWWADYLGDLKARSS